MSFLSHYTFRGLVGTAAVAAVLCVSAFDFSATASEAGGAPEIVMRRLTLDQYQQAIHDVFGPTIEVGGRFDPDFRANGLLAVGAARVGVSSSGMERYDGVARKVASQVVDEDHRDFLVGCKPANEKASDEKCATQFLGNIGELLYRRPLTPAELRARVDAANAAATKLGDFYKGLESTLATMLFSPQFLFRLQEAEEYPKRSGRYRLDAYSKASQLSFLLWNAAPDPQLLAAARSGALGTQKGLAKEVDRLLASPRLEAGVRAFFSDMLGLDGLDAVAKDSQLFRKFTGDVLVDAREQTLRIVVDHLLTKNGDYRDLFTTRTTFLTPLLGSVYRIPVDVPDGGWQKYEYPVSGARAGILTQIAFLAEYGHAGSSSPTLRGKAVREVVLCQRVPDPPANVDFSITQDTHNPAYRTARDRLKAHAANPVCAGCHKITDPIGLALENFDSIGEFRTTENEAQIDASGVLDGINFDDAAGLGKAVHGNPNATSCVVNRAFSYGAGRAPTRDDANFIKSLETDFKSGGYQIKALLRNIATSEQFYRVSAPQAQ